VNDLAQDVAEDVLGAAEDGSVKVFIVARTISHRPPSCPWATREGRAREGRGAGRFGGRCGGRATGRGAGLGLRGPGGARPPRHATTAAAAVLVQLALRCGPNWAAQWHLARAVGKRFRGCRAKRLYVDRHPKKHSSYAYNQGPGPVGESAMRAVVAGRVRREVCMKVASASRNPRRGGAGIILKFEEREVALGGARKNYY